MNAADIAAKLAGEQRDYENALKTTSEVDVVDLSIELIARLDQSDLPNAERERRLTVVYARLAPSPEQASRIASVGARIKNLVLKNALVQLLPAHLKLLTVASADFPVTAHFVSDETIRADTTLSPVISVESAAANHVVILSRDPDLATMRRLEAATFGPLRCETPAELESALGSPLTADICGFLVETSFLEPLDAAEQADVIVAIASYSTFAFIRIQEDALKHSKPAVMAIIRTARCTTLDPSALQVSFQGQAGLRELEVLDLAGAREQIVVARAPGLFSPGELSDGELTLLIAAMTRYAAHKHFGKHVTLTSVRTKFLGGGSTDAKVAVVTLDDLRFPVVVKIASRGIILDEARRFLRFISMDDRDLRPEIHFHGDTSLIIFDVISGSDSDSTPAPTLEDRLRDYWYAEMRGEHSADAAQLLLDAFAIAVRKLSLLNRRPCNDAEIVSKANPYILGIQRMEARGFNWGFGQARVLARNRAAALVEGSQRAAICHGDSHGRNILIRAGQGFLIDYQFSGPGHPCADLAKLELATFLGHFHPFGSEADIVSLQQDLSDCTQGIETLLEKHKNTIVSATNELVVRMCVVARDAAKEVLATHNLVPEHYKSAKLLSAWQALQIPSMQQGLVRATIIALS